METIFTTHAKVRMRQRGITAAQIHTAINNPDSAEETFKERTIARKKFTKGTLEVIYKKLNGGITVITCYWLKEA